MDRSRRWWIPGYGTVVDANKAKVAALATGTGYLGCIIPLVTIAFPHPGISFRWWALAVICGIIVLETLVMGLDLRNLRGDRFRPIPVAKTLAQVLAAVVATGLADYAAGGRGTYRLLVFIPVAIAAVLGNGAFIAVVWAASLGMLGVVSLESGVPAGSLPTLLTVSGIVSLVGAVMVQQLRNSQLRAAEGFDRLTETTEVILKAGGFDEALSRFLPLVALQAEAPRVDAYRRDGEVLVPIGHWPFGAPPLPGGPPALDPGLGQGGSGTHVGAEHTVLFSTDAHDQALVLVVHRKAPNFWREVSYLAAVRRMGVELGLLVNHRDFMAHLDELGRTDSLTGLANRRELTVRLEAELASAQLLGTTFSVAMIDLDHFKDFNDTFGHLEGDQVLVRLARILSECSRGRDLASRYGGEEFCLVLHDTETDGALTVVREVMAALGRIPTPSATPTTCSVGVASSQGHETAESILRAADRALYRAKEDGRARVAVASVTGPAARPLDGRRGTNVTATRT